MIEEKSRSTGLVYVSGLGEPDTQIYLACIRTVVISRGTQLTVHMGIDIYLCCIKNK